MLTTQQLYCSISVLVAVRLIVVWVIVAKDRIIGTQAAMKGHVGWCYFNMDALTGCGAHDRPSALRGLCKCDHLLLLLHFDDVVRR